MSFEEILAEAATEGADLVRVVEDLHLRVLFRVDGCMGFRRYGERRNPPPWRAGLPDADGPLLVPEALSATVESLTLTRRAVHDATVWDVAVTLHPAERRRRADAAASEAARLERERVEREAAWAEAMADRERPVEAGKLARLRAALTATSRPCLPLAVLPGEPTGTEGQLGGTPPWPAGMAWPATEKGDPMAFLAQLDCRSLAALPGMPAHGLLQFFLDLGWDGDWLDIRVAWHPDPAFERADPAALPAVGPDRDGALEHPGRARRLVAGAPAPDLQELDAAFDAANPDLVRGYGAERGHVREERFEAETGPVAEHYVGGWPHACQPIPYEPDTMVLLRLGSRDGLMWSDGGEYHVLIARADLEARAFDKAWAAVESH